MTFKELNIRLKTLVDGLVEKQTMSEIGKLAKDLVVDRTTKGFGVSSPNAPATRLKGLSESYKKQRKYLKKRGKLASETTPKKSNLTKSRQMLASVDSRASTAQAEVYLGNDKARKKAEYQANVGREFMNLSKNETIKIKKILEEKLINDIKKKGL